MAAPNDRFVVVNISLAQVPNTKPAFDKTLLGTYTDAWTGNGAREFADLTAVAVTFPSTGVGSGTYNAAARYFSQTPKPTSLKIARLGAAVVSVFTLKILAPNATGYVWTFTVNGITVSYTEAGGASASTIASGLKTAADTALSGVTTQSVSTDTITFTSVSKDFDLNVVRSKDFAERTEYANTTAFGTTVSVGLTALKPLDDVWYWFALVNPTEAAIKSAQTWLEADGGKFGIFSTSDSENRTDVSGNVLHDGKAASYQYSMVLMHDTQSANHWGPGMAGRLSTMTIGKYTSTFKTITGVTADEVNSTVSNAVRTQNGNTYEAWYGVSMNQSSVTPIGINQDAITIIQKLRSDIIQSLATMFAAHDKVPFTNAGTELAKDAIRTPLEAMAKNEGLVVESIVVSVPELTDITTADKAAHYLSGTTFNAVLSGSIEKVQVNGYLTN
jgi:hypothetical protein